ncbi:MAG: response regulator [Granulosicoccus sp.]
MRSVLLVEDDKKINLALSLRLKSMGFQVSSASDAVYAMNVAQQCNPEVVLLDINLPGGDGFMVADRIRASDTFSSTPIVFITASNEQKFRTRAKEYASCMFLEKPFHSMELIDAIDELCH